MNELANVGNVVLSPKGKYILRLPPYQRDHGQLGGPAWTALSRCPGPGLSRANTLHPPSRSLSFKH